MESSQNIMKTPSHLGDRKHESKYIASVNGPLLFTAPHSGKLNRGGASYNEKKRVHLREKYTSVLAMRFALETASHLKSLGSFCVWAKEHKLND